MRNRVEIDGISAEENAAMLKVSFIIYFSAK